MSNPNCHSLEDELNHDKFEIVKMMSEKEDKAEETKRFKNYEKNISELIEQNEVLKHAVMQLETSHKTDCQKQDANVPIPDILVTSISTINLITSSDGLSPDGQEKETPTNNSQLNLEKEDIDFQNIKLLENNK